MVIGLAAFVRLYPNALVPGWDVDESAYTGIARNVANGEGVRLKPEYIDPGQAKLYTSHPPFGFYLEGGWFRLFGSGVTQARWLAVTASVVTVLLLVFFLRRLMEDKWGALLAGFLIAADGWMTFTNRVGWLENVQLVWGVLALWFYWRVSERVKRYEPLQHRSFFRRLTQRGWWVTYSWLFMAGLVLAAVLVWKQVGVYFLLAGMVHRAIVRPYRRRLPRPEGGVLRRQGMYLWRSMKATVRTVPRVLFGPLSLASALAVAAYIAYMTIWAGPEFFKSTLNQVKRALGLVESRGAVKSTGDIITPLVNQYSIYIGMLIVLAVAGLMVGWRVMRAVVGEDFWANLWVGNFRQLFRFERWYLNSPPADYALLFAWTLAAFMVFGGGKLWLPHYVFMIVLPAYCFLVSGLRRWQRDGIPGDKRAWVVGLVCVLLAGSGLFATYARMVKDPRNPVRDVVVWMDKNAELGSRVVTDEFIGQLIRQPYCKITHAQACEQRGGGRAPDYLILYTTTTQQLPRSAALQRMIDNSTEVYRTQGFKETIIIKRTKRGPPG
ncbi:MAG TPA: glycosyltransferase family 39 protein [Candidatus Saccharimonadales bacterium]|nr:glycosyltransferase family 39 protein [Candidatus Saccharimonadales bacterium]